MPTGAELIQAERERQISEEGWTPEHDDTHANGELAKAAYSYRWHAMSTIKTGRNCVKPPPSWPWDREWWKPSDDPVRDLVKAGALYLAEKERFDRVDWRKRIAHANLEDVSETMTKAMAVCAAMIDELMAQVD